MKSKILLCTAAIAAILYAGCSLINDNAPISPQIENNLPQSVGSGNENNNNGEQPNTPYVTDAPSEIKTPETTVSNPIQDPDAATSLGPEESKTAEKSENPDIKAVTGGVSDNDGSEKPEADKSASPVVTAPSDVENPSKAGSEENGIDKDYMYQTDDDFFFVVNKQLLLPEDYDIKLDYVQGDYKMEVTAAKYMRDMIAAAKEDGIDLKILSTYRTLKYQKNLFERNVKSRMENNGMSYEEAYYDTSINIAPPGGSEHNAGLAADIITKNDWDTYEAFEDTEEFAWLQEHAWEYGYILRYLKDKEDITGYIYEPWHYRYVGVKYAKTVRDSGLCLEEYFEKYVWADGSEPFFPWNNLV